jgi:hypothetical protein
MSRAASRRRFFLICSIAVGIFASSASAADASSLEHYAVHVGSWDKLWEIENDAGLLRIDGGALRTHGETFNGTHVRADLTMEQLAALRTLGVDAVAAAPAVAPRVEDDAEDGPSINHHTSTNASDASTNAGQQGRRRLAQQGVTLSQGTRWSEWRYRSNAEIDAALLGLHRGACAGISHLSSIGKSQDGLDIPLFEISTQPGVPQAKPSFAFIANMHGDEPVGREFVLRLARLLCVTHRRANAGGGGGVSGFLGGLTGKGGGGGGGVGLDAGDAPHAKTAAALVAGARLFLLPTMNPDGFARRRRGNVNNADLNRDFPDQFKNPGMPVGSLNPKP